MRKALYAIIFAVCVSCLAGCTQNNGDIGPLFGFWRLQELTADGDAVEGYTAGDEIWSFQNNIIFIQTLGEAHGYDERAGTWERSATALVLDFTHWRGQNDMEYYYMPPVILGFSTEHPNTLAVEKLNSHEMILHLTTDEGIAMGYVLKKVY